MSSKLLHCCRCYGPGLHACAHLCSELQIWYSVSKTLAERAAWDFAEKEGLQIAVLNPGMVLGPMLTPSVNTSLRLLLQILGGQSITVSCCVANLQKMNIYICSHGTKYLKSANYPGERLDLDDIYMGCVDVRDVAHSLIMLYENPSAQGRHLCIESVERLVDLAK